MKKLFTALLAAVMTVSLAACGNTAPSNGSASGSSAGEKSAPSYPTKDITAIVPYGAGGTTDLCVRSVLDAVPDGTIDSNFIVSNITGGSGLVGATQFANSNADGYTIGVLNCDLVLNNVLGNTEITSDQFIPLCCIENDPYLFVVSKNAPYQTFEEFVDYAKAHPGEIIVADTGSGAANHLAYLALTQDLGLDLKTVAYDSSADSVVAVVSGEAQVSIGSAGAAAGQMAAGEVVALATTSNERLSTFPDVPAMGELYDELADMQVNSWIMLAVRADVNPEIVTFLQSGFAPAATSDEYREAQAGFNFQPVEEMDNQAMLDFVASQQAYYTSLIG